MIEYQHDFISHLSGVIIDKTNTTQYLKFLQWPIFYFFLINLTFITTNKYTQKMLMNNILWAPMNKKYIHLMSVMVKNYLHMIKGLNYA